jgi:hypothetical protein
MRRFFSGAAFFIKQTATNGIFPVRQLCFQLRVLCSSEKSNMRKTPENRGHHLKPFWREHRCFLFVTANNNFAYICAYTTTT